MSLPTNEKPPKLLATTGSTYQTSIASSHDREDELLEGKLGNSLDYRSQVNKGRNPDESNSFRSAEWTPDGTCLITNSEDNCLRTFVVPPDLLSDHPSPLTLKPYSITPHPSTIYCHAIYPYSTLSDPSTTYTLTSTKNHPLQLRSLLTGSIAGIYPFIHHETERYITPSSLIWKYDGTKFYAGSDSLISVFDSSRYGVGPTWSIKGSGRGIVSAMDVSFAGGNGGMIAAGTYTRWFAVYDEGSGDVIDAFNLKSTDGKNGGGGKGITGVKWDSMGRCVYISERRSSILRIYDVRKPGKICGYLRRSNGVGNEASNQKFGFSLGRLGSRSEYPVVLAGSAEGVVDVWTHEVEEGDPYGRDVKVTEKKDGKVEGKPIGGWAAHDDPVTSVAVHPTGCVIATCSGERKLLNSINDSYSESGSSGSEDGGIRKEEVVWDNSLKIWSI